MTRQEAIRSLREICREIGCSGMSSRCKTHPHLCHIIRGLFRKSVNTRRCDEFIRSAKGTASN